MTRPAPGYRSKTLATWLALLGGSFGLHRFYLNGLRDAWGWLHPPLAVLGLYGVQRVHEFGQDDHLSWVLIPLLGSILAGSMLMVLSILGVAGTLVSDLLLLWVDPRIRFEGGSK
mgnify:CR=1 FL=1